MAKQQPNSDIDSQLVLEALAIELKVLRSKMQFSQEQLALRANVNRTFVGKLEARASQPSLLVLMRLLAALEVSLPDFSCALVQRIATLERVKRIGVRSVAGRK